MLSLVRAGFASLAKSWSCGALLLAHGRGHAGPPLLVANTVLDLALPTRSLACSALLLPVLQCLRSGFCASLRSLAQSSSLLLCGFACPGCPVLALGSVNVGPLPLVKAPTRCSMSALDFASSGALLLTRTMHRLGFMMSWTGSIRPASGIPVASSHVVGSLLLPRALGHLGSIVFVPGTAQTGPLLSLRCCGRSDLAASLAALHSPICSFLVLDVVETGPTLPLHTSQYCGPALPVAATAPFDLASLPKMPQQLDLPSPLSARPIPGISVPCCGLIHPGLALLLRAPKQADISLVVVDAVHAELPLLARAGRLALLMPALGLGCLAPYLLAADCSDSGSLLVARTCA